jgi:hypothetical protein
MKSYLVGVGVSLLMMSSLAFSQEQAAASAPAAGEKGAQEYYAMPASVNGVCIVRGVPAATYTFIKDVKVAKDSYGAANLLLPELAEMAKGAGADAIVEYSGSQRFGFWPWRLIRPVVYGKAVKWTDPSKVDCAALAAVGEAAHQAEVKRRAAAHDAKVAAKAAKNAPATPAAPAAEVPSAPVAPAEPAK